MKRILAQLYTTNTPAPQAPMPQITSAPAALTPTISQSGSSLSCDGLNVVPSRFGMAPFFVTFTGFAHESNPANTGIISYHFDFGDGNVFNPTGGGNGANNTYEKPGTYKAVLTVTDSLGQATTSNSCFADIVVSASVSGTPSPIPSLLTSTPVIRTQPSSGVNMFLTVSLLMVLLLGIIVRHVSAKNIR